MAITYQLIASTELTTTAATVNFLSIPQTYTDLKLVCTTRLDNSSLFGDIQIYINNNQNAIYDYQRLITNGSTLTAASATGNAQLYANYAGNGNTSTASVYGQTEFYICNYANGVNAKKIWVDAFSENNGTQGYVTFQGHFFNDSTPITSLYLFNSAPNFMANSSFYLYGIKNS